MGKTVSRILIVDANAPWVRWLFAAMPQRVEVSFLRVLPIGMYRHQCPRPWSDAFRWREVSPRIKEQWVPTLGWSKLGAASTAIVAQRCRAALRPGQETTIIYTLPFYAGVAQRLRGQAPQVYFAHDPFRYYAGWNAARVEACESRLFKSCDAAVAISRQLAQDFRGQTATPVFDCPNATSREFAQSIAGAAPPAELAGLPGPIVGCIGQINSSYDWDLIQRTAALLPEATFAFVGPIIAESPETQTRIRSILAGPNLRWLGPKDHAALPGYLRGFTVCWNPMKINQHNHRRSPLRLYDYLATDHPVLSTPVAEVHAHGGLVATAAGAQESAALLQRMIRGEHPIDVGARRRYLAVNNWEARAAQLLEYLENPSRSDISRNLGPGASV